MHNMFWLVVILFILNLLALGWMIYRTKKPSFQDNEDSLLSTFQLNREEVRNNLNEQFKLNRGESTDNAQKLREEFLNTYRTATDTAMRTMSEMRKSQQEGLESVEKRVQSLTESNENRFDKLHDAIEKQMLATQSGNQVSIEKMQKAITTTVSEMKLSQQEQLQAVEERMRLLTEQNDKRMETLRETVNQQMQSLQENNEKKLDQMRETVNEKLHKTLETRLGESFKLVSERLEAVQRGLGDMQHLATGVGDLKRVLTNVKTRGTWGEVQLGDILEQLLTPDQYQKNKNFKEGSTENVEYAIRLPGKGEDEDCWLPIDAKFPQEDYHRLLDAAEKADAAEVEKSTAALMRTIQNSAKTIASKYIVPPKTTDFALMFLPTEGLYSEILRQPGIVEKLQLEHRVVVAGPTTLSAILSSLKMGFKTLAIEKRSSEVWQLLAAVKTEFKKFDEHMKKVKKQLDTAVSSIDFTSVRTRAIDRKLNTVEELPCDEAVYVLGFNDNHVSDDSDSD